MNTVRVSLSPTPGFCIKSTALHSATCNVTVPPPSPSILDGPSILPATITIPKGSKIFINIAWDSNVPPPPSGSEDAIQKAMLGEDLDADAAGDGWFVPVVVSEPRQDTDKAGKPSVVFDCIYNSSLKSRALKDAEFKTFLIVSLIVASQFALTFHLALSLLIRARLPADRSTVLRPTLRQIGTPNIPSKGKLYPRTALIPIALYPEEHPERVAANKEKKPLIEEVDVPSTRADSPKNTQKPRGILKKPGPLVTPPFSWSKSGDGLRITFAVPKLTHELIKTSSIDIEPHRLIISVPSLYLLDLDLDAPDAQILEKLAPDEVSAQQALTLKRQRELNVDGAQAEWRVAEGMLIVLA
ncbi:PIH1 domain-containing protein 1 [Grifola frondosa]|uniref:PIH1 domain-containing protein 1 n=1 Tax=Grifola frondosa TaxID=5627 RepID=A0A1C7MDL5_GRIFR|nr:PIH1 domain-containing protein 1 [Grifola frondosa]